MRRLANKTRVEAPDSQFSFGRIKDTTPGNPGTPVNEDSYGDMHQFFEKLMAESGVEENELPDSDYSGYQLFEALMELGFNYFSKDIILAMLRSYTTNDLIIMHGFDIVLSGGNNTATWTAGAVFYNGKIYKVDAGNLTKTGGQTFIYVIEESATDIFTITIDKGSSGSGIADYAASTVKKYIDIIRGTWTNLTLLNSYTGFGDQSGIKYKVDLFGNLTIRGAVDTGTVTNVLVATLPAGSRPAHNYEFRVTTAAGEFPEASYNIVISTTGNIFLQMRDGNLVDNGAEVIIDLPVMTIY